MKISVGVGLAAGQRLRRLVLVSLGTAALLVSSGAAASAPQSADPSDGSSPLVLPGHLAATAIAAGDYHTCALTSAGGVRCWGGNGFGQLGDGSTIDRHGPVAVSGLASGVAAIAAGGEHTCALTSAGGVKCWGLNAHDQLGDGTRPNLGSPTPVNVRGLTSGVVAIAAGSQHTCALTSAGAVKCWGYNDSGQLGDGTTTDRNRPVAVSGLASGVAAIAARSEHTCALTSAGAVKCWGENDIGELGDGTTTEHKTPVAVTGLTSGVAAIAAGDAHTCALTSSGGVRCWGWNVAGELGDGTTTEHDTPVAVSGLASGVAAIAAGGFHTCALTSSGVAKCWGANGSGDLGDATTTDRLIPADVSGLASGVAAIAAGYSHTCALTTSGVAKCWGANHFGQLGDGTTTDRHTPVEVIGAPPPCIVPNVIGKLLSKAKATIAKANCRVGTVTKKPSTLKKKGRVLAQKPRAGKTLKNRATVNLTVG
jgi:alpha-tubulin suppressor-like RCC1 family protein